MIVQHGLNEYNGGTGEDIEGDIKVKVVSGTDTSHQGEDVIGKSFDGDYSTLYHSNWSNGGANYFPITLTYNFAEVSDVDYLIYYPRPSGYNGNFKEVEIQYSEDGNVFTKLLDKDFEVQRQLPGLLLTIRFGLSLPFYREKRSGRRPGSLFLVPKWNSIPKT